MCRARFRAPRRARQTAAPSSDPQGLRPPAAYLAKCAIRRLRNTASRSRRSARSDEVSLSCSSAAHVIRRRQECADPLLQEIEILRDGYHARLVLLLVSLADSFDLAGIFDF